MSEDGVPELKTIPPMLRRRLNRTARIALHTATECLSGQSHVPMVFASRNGETPRSVQLLAQLMQNEQLSPTDFGLSVHNATGGLFTIARGDTASCSSLASGKETMPHAVIEAVLQLQEAPAVLLVLSEDILPQPFIGFADETQHTFACSLLITRTQSDGECLQLHMEPATAPAPEPVEELPWALQLVRLLAGSEPHLHLQGQQRLWSFNKVAHAD